MAHNNNIKCSVCTCVHQTPDNYCSASSIQVAPANAKTPNETGCMTFKAE